jgi:hypothetical protein
MTAATVKVDLELVSGITDVRRPERKLAGLQT